MRQIIRNRILDRFNHKCVFCGSTENLHIDHIIPVSRGGREDEDNMQVLCRTCNLKKHNSIDYSPYFKKGDGENYIMVRTDFPLYSTKDNELQLLLDHKFRELCND